ncbi:MAG: secretin N-terminal domain-containing protein [Candidatus Gastranaerophilales bacterium]|nr:secretin N-terminal domain-containing protein [Candidatus Gastranaerophilales bacterium]
MKKTILKFALALNLTLLAVICLCMPVFSMNENTLNEHIENRINQVKKEAHLKNAETNIIPANLEMEAEETIDTTREVENLYSLVNNDSIKLFNSFNAFDDAKKTNLVLDQIDVPSVLRILAEEGNKNIVLDESVQGFITAELKNVSLNEAMQVILTGEELEARVEGNTIFVASRPAMAKKGINRKYIKAFKLNNANSVEVAKILEASVFNKGYNVNESTENAITPAVMTENEDLPNAPAIANTAQSSTGQSSLSSSRKIKGRVEELETGAGFGDANILASQIKIQQKKATTKDIEISNNDGGAIIIPDTRTNSVLVAGLKEDILLAEKTIQYLDKPLQQVAIEVSLVEITKDDTKDLGFSYSQTGNKASGGFNSTIQNTLHDLGSPINQSVFGFSSVGGNADAFYGRINALIQNEKAKLLANPTITALDNSEALIKITDQVVSKMEVVVTQTSTTYDVTLADVGIVLNILPKIGEDGNITMRLRPSITTPLAEKAVGTFGAFVTPISTREVIIEDVRVKSGDTFAIAGLIKDQEIETLGKIPFAGDLPVFGKLFRNKEHAKHKTELMILIKPKIVKDIANNAL